MSVYCPTSSLPRCRRRRHLGSWYIVPPRSTPVCIRTHLCLACGSSFLSGRWGSASVDVSLYEKNSLYFYVKLENCTVFSYHTTCHANINKKI